MLRCHKKNKTVSVFTFISNLFVFMFLEPSKTSRRTGPPVNQISFEPLSKYSRSALNFKYLDDSLRKKKKNMQAPFLVPFSSPKSSSSTQVKCQVTSIPAVSSETFCANLQRPTTQPSAAVSGSAGPLPEYTNSLSLLFICLFVFPVDTVSAEGQRPLSGTIPFRNC